MQFWISAHRNGKRAAKLEEIDLFIFKPQKRIRRISWRIITQSELSILILAPNPDHAFRIDSHEAVLADGDLFELVGQALDLGGEKEALVFGHATPQVEGTVGSEGHTSFVGAYAFDVLKGRDHGRFKDCF